MKQDAPEIIRFLREEDGFQISTHIHPDGDAIGSELALAYMLRSLGKRFRILNESPLPDLYHFLPGVCQAHAMNGASLPLSAADRPRHLVSLDCGSRERLGRVATEFRFDTVINIDHHITNTLFGDLNWVDSETSSTAEILYEVLTMLEIPLAVDLAVCLYTGILTDTGNFNYANTSSRCHRLVSRMIEEGGVDPAAVSRSLYRSESIARLKIKAMVIQNITTSPGGKVAWGAITREMRRQAGADFLDTLDAVTLPISLEGIRVGMLFREMDNGETKVSFRSDETTDVSSLAIRFGGGGHPQAAGCSIGMDLEKTRELIVPLVVDLIEGDGKGRADTRRVRGDGTSGLPA